MLRATQPTIAEIVLDVISLEYHETIMAPSGHAAEKSQKDVLKNHKGKYIAIVEGAIPMKDEGIYCTIGGHSALDIAREVCENALTTLAVGSCASWGGVASANPNPTGCVGVKEAVPNATVVNLPGCPVNVENITATIVHFLTFGSLPARDARLRPLFGSVESAMNAAVLLNWKKPMSSHARFAPLVLLKSIKGMSWKLLKWR